jgi:hypothetical protein
VSTRRKPLDFAVLFNDERAEEVTADRFSNGASGRTARIQRILRVERLQCTAACPDYCVLADKMFFLPSQHHSHQPPSDLRCAARYVVLKGSSPSPHTCWGC